MSRIRGCSGHSSAAGPILVTPFRCRRSNATRTSRSTKRTLATDSLPAVKTHPRVAILHSWLSTQDEGWWRHAFDDAAVPYSYISVQDVARNRDLHATFDAIVFPPVGRASDVIISGQPTGRGNPLPWKKTAETPNLGSEDETDDTRPGLGYTGIANLQQFVKSGGLLVTAMDTATLATTTGLAPGVALTPSRNLRGWAVWSGRRWWTRRVRSGLVEGGAELAQRPAVIDVPVGEGHVVLFSNNPVWRGETHGSYFLVFNAILNFDHLDAGRTPDAK